MIVSHTQPPYRSAVGATECDTHNHGSRHVTAWQGAVDLEAADEYGYTALMAAAEWGKWEVLEALLAAGARAEARDLDGETALMWAKNYTDNDPTGKCVSILEAAGA